MKKTRVALSVAIAGLAFAGTALTVYSNPLSSLGSDSISSDDTTAQRNENPDPDHWTSERMRNAKPEHMPGVD
ncbi:hypothetical protein [Bifidobacterium sp. ESL0704]|uniref:hypothetical protein n=1 Tax=Bifidobacterium sp. ESL0704 TaxID=2983219 RepID=UPI0023F8327A|nr:hypothetical protein [Bifidobacterium sp. ESL0704]WEV52943.1 hypothetical protein OZX64_00035 [Bifidobacterium sp. ESL0704]